MKPGFGMDQGHRCQFNVEVPPWHSVTNYKTDREETKGDAKTETDDKVEAKFASEVHHV